jgi:glycosyltransferase involved in cell wall biosynthesis
MGGRMRTMLWRVRPRPGKGLPSPRRSGAAAGEPPPLAVDPEEARDARLGSLSAAARLTDVPTVSLVIPARNEAMNLPHVLTRIPACVTEVVVVDGHSIDDTIGVARALRADVRVVAQVDHGKGDALGCGLAAASGQILVTLDADGSMDPAEIPRFVSALLDGSDYAKGTRFVQAGGTADITRVRRIGNQVLTQLVNTLFGASYSDLCYGYNAFWRDCLPQLQIDCSGFEVEALMNIRAARARLAVTEVPSFEYERLFGESSLNAVRDGLRIARVILRERMHRRGWLRARHGVEHARLRIRPAPPQGAQPTVPGRSLDPARGANAGTPGPAVA